MITAACAGALEEAMSDCHIIVFTGGSSVGAADFTAGVIDDLGPPGVLVHGVSIKPGKPLIIGLVKRKKPGPLFPSSDCPGTGPRCPSVSKCS